MNVPAERLHDLTRRVFAAAGSAPGEATAIADHLVESNLQGHDSHGVLRIAKYLDWWRAGQVLANRHLEVTTDLGALVAVDGGFGYGQAIGREAIELAIDRAREHGLCVLALRNSGHLGRIGAWAEQAAEAGLVSLHLVNTSGFGILVAPFGGSDRRLSANPIGAGVPVAGGAPLILDIATSKIAEGKIQMVRNWAGMLPEGCVLDGAGHPTCDPAAFYGPPPGAILPFGEHKGSGLSFFCEVLAGALTGGGSSHPESPSAPRLVNNMLSLLLEPSRIAGEAAFAADLERLIGWVKASPPATPDGEVLLPGELERRVRTQRLASGIPLDATTSQQLADAAASVEVDAAAALETTA